jgi:hypothetical protein
MHHRVASIAAAAAAAGLAGVAWGIPAHAQDGTYSPQGGPYYQQGTPSYQTGTPMYQREAPYQPTTQAPTNTFELNLGAGYTQGFGFLAPGRSIHSVAGAGAGFNLNLDYRANPFVSYGIEGQYQEFTSERNAASRGAEANIGVTGHAAPSSNFDPWLRLGTGYRLLWDVNPVFATNTTNLYHGFDIITGKIGLDLRPSQGIAIAPVVGADVQTFVWRDSTALSSARVGTFVFGGLQGRFDAPNSQSTGVAKSQ